MTDDNHPNPCCGGNACDGLDRREFLKTAGAGLVSLTALGQALPAAAGLVVGRRGVDHFVPADKRLTAEWLRGLYEKGAPHVCRGAELNLIGMPVGGIGAGQVYLCGDGTLACWKIFNRTYFSGYGDGNYQPHMPDKPIAQGFAVVVRDGEAVAAHELSRRDFPDAEFLGEYPLGRVRYVRPDCPAHVELSAFSPFIPLNARDSALPATVLEHTIENASDRPVDVALLGWLENAVCFHSTREFGPVTQRRSRVVDENGRTLLVHTGEPVPVETPAREDIVLADFEGGTYGDWTVEGTAFGDKPATGTLPKQNPVTGFSGEGLVNSYAGDDDAQGRLLSSTFTIERNYICFLIGGGKHPNEACINLLVDGKAVRTATGRSEERLLWSNWDVKKLAGKTAQIEVVDKRQGPWGHINIDQVIQSDRRRFGATGRVEDFEDFGTMVLVLGEPAASPADTEALLADIGGWQSDLLSAADAGIAPDEQRTPCLATRFVALQPGEKRTIRSVIAWHFPNRAEGNMYAEWFDSAAAVARRVLDDYDRLSGHTRLWHETYYDSTLPHWLLDRLHYPVANLATGTCLWWKNGRFWAWEGVGCCEGTCTHVWNYAHALSRLFPELERSAREMQDLGVALHEDGLVGFRGQHNRAYAADGQAGTVLKCYREHLMSVDDSFLRRNWLHIKQVLAFSLKQDGNDDGLIENTQHNTFDINFEGANTFVGSLYLAALRAGEEMAREAGDEEFAERVRRVFESGQRLTLERLWNGEYFVQEVDLAKHPKHQYGPGCLSDQVFGQGWAHQLSLGYIYPAEQIRTALESIWKYNWAPDVAPQSSAHEPQRWFARPGEAGLFTCTWPKSKHLAEGVLYREEVWTGIEYQVAGHMIWEGLVEKGLAIVRAVHDRYDPLKHNPYNEVECGDHYARALASWGVYLALCGYEYHGPTGRLAFAPRLTPEDFRAAFTTAEGWGTFAQRYHGTALKARVELRWGRLRLTTLALAVPEAIDGRQARVHIGDRKIPAAGWRQGGRVTVSFAEAVNLNAGETLEVVIGT